MQVSVNWLNEFVDLSNTEDAQIAHELTMSGLEVEAVEEVKPQFTNIITVKIEKIDNHPNSDHLHLITVNTGSGLKTVVCPFTTCQCSERWLWDWTESWLFGLT